MPEQGVRFSHGDRGILPSGCSCPATTPEDDEFHCHAWLVHRAGIPPDSLGFVSGACGRWAYEHIHGLNYSCKPLANLNMGDPQRCEAQVEE